MADGFYVSMNVSQKIERTAAGEAGKNINKQTNKTP